MIASFIKPSLPGKCPCLSSSIGPVCHCNLQPKVRLRKFRNLPTVPWQKKRLSLWRKTLHYGLKLLHAALQSPLLFCFLFIHFYCLIVTGTVASEATVVLLTVIVLPIVLLCSWNQCMSTESGIVGLSPIWGDWQQSGAVKACWAYNPEVINCYQAFYSQPFRYIS